MNRLMHEQVYVDTNIFIAAIEGFHSKALALLQMAEKGLLFLVSSEVTRGEVLVKPIMQNNQALMARYQSLLDDSDRISTLAVDDRIITEAARLSATEGLELLDAVHCATATIADCAFIISNDHDMRHYAQVDVLTLDDLESLT